MKAYMCSVCNYLYDDESAEQSIENLPLNFEDLPDDWICPGCGVTPDLFKEAQSDRISDINLTK